MAYYEPTGMVKDLLESRARAGDWTGLGKFARDAGWTAGEAAKYANTLSGGSATAQQVNDWMGQQGLGSLQFNRNPFSLREYQTAISENRLDDANAYAASYGLTPNSNNDDWMRIAGVPYSANKTPFSMTEYQNAIAQGRTQDADAYARSYGLTDKSTEDNWMRVAGTPYAPPPAAAPATPAPNIDFWKLKPPNMNGTTTTTGGTQTFNNTMQNPANVTPTLGSLTGANAALPPANTGAPTTTTTTPQQKGLSLEDLSNWWTTTAQPWFTQQQKSWQTPTAPTTPAATTETGSSLGTLYPRANWSNYQSSGRGSRYFNPTSGKYQQPQTQQASL